MRSSGASTSPTSSVASLRAGVSRILVVLLVASVAGCPASRAIEIRRSEAPPKVDLSLGPGDVFDVRVFGEADLSSTYRVASNGTIDFPLVGRIAVQGQTPTEAAEEIQRRLERYLKRPQVSVLLREANSKKITVYGQVQKPGTLPYSEQMTISQAISLAGGLTAMAARDATRVTRVRGGKTETIRVNLKSVDSGSATYYLLPGDEVFVPERIF